MTFRSDELPVEERLLLLVTSKWQDVVELANESGLSLYTTQRLLRVWHHKLVLQVRCFREGGRGIWRVRRRPVDPEDGAP